MEVFCNGAQDKRNCRAAARDSGWEAKNMLMRYELEPLTLDEAARWDELIAPYGSRQLFHSNVWLDYLAASRGVDIRRWAIWHGGHLVGYFCGGILRKGPFRILGSPLRSWITNDMGPVASSEFDQEAFLQALEDLVARERFAMVEIESPMLSEPSLGKLGYEPEAFPTYLVELNPEDPKKMWARLHSSARRAVRIAGEAGLTVEDSDDPAVTDEVYDGYVELLARKNIAPTFQRSVPRVLFDYLRPRGMLFALGVREPGGKMIATGLFPHNEKTVYFGFTGSRVAWWHLFPNDFLHWKAIEISAGHGLRLYNMSGYGRFKSKFGGTLEQRRRWHKCYWRTACWARRSYEFYFKRRIRSQAWWQRVVRSPRGA
jgi:hypothetical protein